MTHEQRGSGGAAPDVGAAPTSDKRARRTRAVTLDDMDIGRRIRARRLQRGFSQQFLANAIGLTFQQVQKYERGTNRVAATTLVAIARALGAPVAAFLPREAVCEEEAIAPSDDVDALILACLRLDDDGRAKTLRFIETLERTRA